MGTWLWWFLWLVFVPSSLVSVGKAPSAQPVQIARDQFGSQRPEFITRQNTVVVSLGIPNVHALLFFCLNLEKLPKQIVSWNGQWHMVFTLRNCLQYLPKGRRC